MKPIDCVEFFNLQEGIFSLTSSTDSSIVAQIHKSASTKSSTSVKKTSHEASGQIASVNEPQENRNSSGVVSIEQAYFSFKKDI